MCRAGGEGRVRWDVASIFIFSESVHVYFIFRSTTYFFTYNRYLYKVLDPEAQKEFFWGVPGFSQKCEVEGKFLEVDGNSYD